MKIKHLFGLAVIAAMTASCSSNEDLGTAGPGTGTNETGVGYASFSINLPTTSGTRADDDLTFENGDANEYKVNDATLLIFKKGGEATKEGDYTFVECAELGSMAPWKDKNEPGVTTHAKITAKLDKVNRTDKFFALVLLNNGTVANAKVTLPTDGEKFSKWNTEKVTNKFATPENGFYMANAPLFENNNVTTLVPIVSDKIYPTEEEAAKNPATDIYVERGLAKVTLGTGTTTEKTVTSDTYQGDKVTISKWALDVTNKKAYPIHNVDGLNEDYTEIWNNNATTSSSINGANTQRFVDNNTATLAKRVYWGIDPNYNDNSLCTLGEAGKTAREKEFNYVTANTDVKAEPTTSLYCLENTFNLDNMMQGQTTRVIFKATYKPASLHEGEKTFYKIGKNTAIWREADLKQEIEAAVASVVSGAAGKTTVTLNAEGNDITAAGTHYIEAANISVTGATITPENITAINTQLGLNRDKKVGISTYADGESYYVARIMHFGDALTKWDSSMSYGTDNLSFLGRYGVLRNNWYELTVNSVSGPGYPSVPEVKPETPDDENDNYIKVSVKILKWAKRSQKVYL